MFYEAESNFFYDPSAKLYYSHEKQGYFRHRLADNGKSLYDKVEHVPSTESECATTTGSSITDKQMMIPAISINLKTKSLGKKGKKKKDDTGQAGKSVPLPPTSAKTTKKETEADLAKWSQRQTELKAGNRDLSKIPKTTKGEPICSLCKRKFPTLEKLFYHEQVSELHKTNLAKQATARSDVTATKTGEARKPSYVDRAEQRRVLQGPETAVAIPSAEPAVSIVSAKVDPKETLNESNIGNQMLKKLGWQQGEGLGRRGTEVSNNLQQDWERIERMTAANGGGK
jgi:RNA-binding protein 5/10